MQIMAEQRIENGLLSVTLKILNLPNCPYTKKSCWFFQSYEKSRAKQKKLVYFFAETKGSLRHRRKATESKVRTSEVMDAGGHLSS